MRKENFKQKRLPSKDFLTVVVMKKSEAISLVEYYLRELENLEKQRKRIYEYLVKYSKEFDLVIPIS